MPVVIPLREYSAASHQSPPVHCPGAASVDVAIEIDTIASGAISAKVITSRRLGPQSSTSVSFGQSLNAAGEFSARVSLPEAITEAALLIENSGGAVKLRASLIPVR